MTCPARPGGTGCSLARGGPRANRATREAARHAGTRERSSSGRIGSARKWAHYTYLLVAVSWIFLLFAVLFRFRLVPRVPAGLGMMASLLQILGAAARHAGLSTRNTAGHAAGAAYVALALWLMVRGFDQGQYPVEPEADRLEVAQVS